MWVLLNIQDSKAPFIMQILQHFKYVKAKAITKEKALLIEDFKEAIEEIKLVKQGKLKARPVEDLINEL